LEHTLRGPDRHRTPLWQRSARDRQKAQIERENGPEKDIIFEPVVR
jgi:hypothetical protein